MTWLPVSLRKLLQLEENVCRLTLLYLPASLHVSLHTQLSPPDSRWTSCHHPASSMSSFSWTIPVSTQTYCFFPLGKSKTSKQTNKNLSWCHFPLGWQHHISPSLSSKALVRIVYTCKCLCYYFLLNPLCWCFCPHDFTEYVFIKDMDDIPVTKPHWSILHVISLFISFGHIWSLSPTPSPPSSLLPGPLLAWWSACLSGCSISNSLLFPSHLSDLWILKETKTPSVDFFSIHTHTMMSLSVSQL